MRVKPKRWCFPLLVLAVLCSGLAHAQPEGELVELAVGLETTELLRRLGEPLALAAELPPKEVQFHVVLSATLNAFALPNRHIVFNSGLLLAVKDRDEMAGVMAHEIAHLMAGHHTQLTAISKKTSIRTMITTAAGLLAGMATGNSQLGQAVITGGAASGQTTLLEAIRSREAQADTLAVSLLARSGFKPEGLAGFMTRLVRQQHISALPPPYLLTHPISSERLMDIRRLVTETTPTAPPRPVNDENQLLARAQAILEAESHDSPDLIANQFRNRLRLDPGNLALNSGLAEALRSAGQLQEAETLLGTLLQGRSKDPYLFRNRGLVRIEMGQYQEAWQDLQVAIDLLPDNADLRYRQAFALKELKKPQDASRILRQLTAQYPEEPKYFYLLGITDGQGGREGEGHIAMGRYYLLIQERKNAIWHFQEAVRLLPAGSSEQNIARNELTQAKKMEPEPTRMERKRR